MKRAPSSQFPDLPSVTVKPHGQKRLDHGHPWVYSNEVEMDAAAKAVPPGGLVRLCDAQGRYRATAFFNRHPLIAARVLTRDETVAIDTEFLTRRLRRALALRERLLGVPCYRLVHAEADGLPGVIIGRFGDALTLQVNTAGMELLTPPLIDALNAVVARSEEHTSELQSLMRISYAVFCLKKKKKTDTKYKT